MHHCVNLFCVQNVAEQIPALYVTLYELQQNSNDEFLTGVDTTDA